MIKNGTKSSVASWEEKGRGKIMTQKKTVVCKISVESKTIFYYKYFHINSTIISEQTKLIISETSLLFPTKCSRNITLYLLRACLKLVFCQPDQPH